MDNLCKDLEPIIFDIEKLEELNSSEKLKELNSSEKLEELNSSEKIIEQVNILYKNHIQLSSILQELKGPNLGRKRKGREDEIVYYHTQLDINLHDIQIIYNKFDNYSIDIIDAMIKLETILSKV